MMFLGAASKSLCITTDFFFLTIYDFICLQVALSGGKTLVHCVAGISRSASVCIAYLMKYHGLSLLEAYNDVKLKRPLIRPNCAFFKQLMKYENSLYGCTSVAMVYNEYLKMEIPDVYDSQYQYLNAYRKKCRSKIGRF